MAWQMSFSQDKSIILIRPQNKSQKILTRKEIRKAKIWEKGEISKSSSKSSHYKNSIARLNDISNMEIDEAEVKKPNQTTVDGIMAAVGTAGSVSVSLHPLVIMNVAEQWTRCKVQNGGPLKIFGALIGKQKGRNVEVMNSFELDVVTVDGKVIMDRDYYNEKEGQFKQVFSEMDFLGWYSTGEAPTEDDISFHKQICEVNESPLFLQLNPISKKPSDLPICVFESVIDIVGGETRMLFVKLGYNLATEEVCLNFINLSNHEKYFIWSLG